MGFSNAVANTGQATTSLVNATTYLQNRVTQNWTLLNNLYRGHWVVRRVCSVVAEDMLKPWFKIVGDIEVDNLNKFERVVKKTYLYSKLLSGFILGRLYGGAIGLILLDGEDDLSEPLDVQNIQPGSFKGLMILDRWQGCYPTGELVNDINNPEFGLPEFYEIQDFQTNAKLGKVHHSRVLRFIGNELTSYERTVEQWWGASEVESMWDAMIGHDNVFQNIVNLTFKANTQVYAVKDLDQLYAIQDVEQQNKFTDKMMAIAQVESSFGIRLINTEDRIVNLPINFTGLPEVQDRAKLELSGAVGIPATRLFGQSPAGQNATGESDLRNYDDRIDTDRKTKLTPILDKLLPIVAMSTWGNVPEDFDYTYGSIRPLSDPDKMQLAQAKAQTLFQSYQMDMISLGGAMQELKNTYEELSLFTEITDEQIAQNMDEFFSKKQQEMMQSQATDPMAGLMGMFGQGNEEEPMPEEALPAEESIQTIENEQLPEESLNTIEEDNPNSTSDSVQSNSGQIIN